MKKVIITGANGFIGYWLTREMVKHNIEVIAVVKDENENIGMLENMQGITIAYCDLENIINLCNIVPDAEYDAFYHLAWIAAGGAGRANYGIQLMNSKYACDAANVAKKLKCKKFLSSGTITEKIAEKVLENSSKADNTIYGVIKHTTHCLLDIVCKRLELPYIWMQLSNLYGPYSVNGNIVGYTIDALLENREATFGSATQPYDLLYIEDLVHAAYLLGFNKNVQSCYYIGSGQPQKLCEYLSKVGDIMGKPELIKIGSRPDDGLVYDISWFDISSLVRDTEYKPENSFEKGLKKTIEWMECSKNAF